VLTRHIAATYDGPISRLYEEGQLVGELDNVSSFTTSYLRYILFHPRYERRRFVPHPPRIGPRSTPIFVRTRTDDLRLAVPSHRPVESGGGNHGREP